MPKLEPMMQRHTKSMQMHTERSGKDKNDYIQKQQAYYGNLKMSHGTTQLLAGRWLNTIRFYRYSVSNTPVSLTFTDIYSTDFINGLVEKNIQRKNHILISSSPQIRLTRSSPTLGKPLLLLFITPPS
ncbi:hypothetical protein BgiBS90_018887 [Biomphalaria glabrata]|nr:hypothetical protein BgiBS90_018887 [Biomphalaria glabrata]